MLTELNTAVLQRSGYLRNTSQPETTRAMCTADRNLAILCDTAPSYRSGHVDSGHCGVRVPSRKRTKLGVSVIVIVIGIVIAIDKRPVGRPGRPGRPVVSS